MTHHATVRSELSPAAKRLIQLDGPGFAEWRKRRHLLDTNDLAVDELEAVIEAAGLCKEIAFSERAPQPLLSGKVIAHLFYESSTRTRSSFQLAAMQLGASVLNLDIANSSVSKGETIADTGLTLASMGASALVQRHACSGSAVQIARSLGSMVQILNAGDGWNAHPTQALLDYFTMRQFRRNLNGVKVAIIGDIAHSRVARSNIWLLQKVGAEIHVAGPPTLLPMELDKLGVSVHDRIEPAIRDADFVIVLRLQVERQAQGLIPSIGEYRRIYRLDSAKLTRLAKPTVKVMHPGPMNRGIEISHELADNPDRSLVSTQVSNGVAVRMAVLYLLLSGGEDSQQND